MEEKYSIVEYTDIHFMHAEDFPNRRYPDSRTLTRIHKHLRENGSRLQERPGRPKILAPVVEER